jgi:hypothetical protein
LSRELPSVLEEGLFHSPNGSLKIDLDCNHIVDDIPPFAVLLCAYLDHHRFARHIRRLEINLVCGGEWGNELASCDDWSTLDARLSDAVHLPYLNSFGITLINMFMREGGRLVDWGSDPVKYRAQWEMAKNIVDRFDGAQARGIDVTVGLD